MLDCAGLCFRSRLDRIRGWRRKILRSWKGRLASFAKLKLIWLESVSRHTHRTRFVRPQLELIAEFALAERLPLMMHAAESQAEEDFVRHGTGIFAESLAKRGIEWTPPRTSTIQYLNDVGILGCQPLLAHCIRVDHDDIETLQQTGSKVAHCPKSNAKLGHGRAPLASFLEAGVTVGLGSDSVASNNTCDLIEESSICFFIGSRIPPSRPPK